MHPPILGPPMLRLGAPIKGGLIHLFFRPKRFLTIFSIFLVSLTVFHVILNENKTHCPSPHTLHESIISLLIPLPTHYAPLSPLIPDRLSEHWMSTGEQCYRGLLSSWLPQQHSIWVALLPHGISSSPNKDGDTREQCLSDHSQGVFQDAGWTTPRVPLSTSVPFEPLSHLLKQEFLRFESLHHFLLHPC